MKQILLSALAIAFVMKGYSQSAFVLTYPISFPMGDHNDYISKTSWRGINMEFLKQTKQGVAVGLETGWNVFYEKVDKKEYKEGTATISGVQYRYTNAVPILAEAKYYPMSDKRAAASFVGVGVGTLFVSRSTDFGLYRLTTDAWQFCIRPEAGVVFEMQPGMKAIAGVKWYPAFDTDDLDGQSFLSINVGFVFSSL